MQTEKSEQLRSVASDTRGKHRISAELKRLEQETRFLEMVCKFMSVFHGNALLLIGRMGRRIHRGIDGSRDLKISQVADAGYCNNILRKFYLISPCDGVIVQSRYRYREQSSLPRSEGKRHPNR
ncbi:hypothetical protein Ccrd_006695 [Cynara cardunculus var. scolymus]|uniref:Uncharacterized protein n=1 Tax=Cynara cardunculus var. scolymus TaxID=59895 RepID=A0A118JUC1_CYNCS|nr:hypothetical protein Ccrd_006695 [Cynara cardunculus var. scolymus]